jgi:hypothetical protein
VKRSASSFCPSANLAAAVIGCFTAISICAQAGTELFTNGEVRRIRIEIASEGLADLRGDPRKFVRATVSDGGLTISNVGVHLKGSTGSFRAMDDKPALTLSFGKFSPGQSFHGLSKIHLNNSVEDPSYLHELLGSELFRAAGVPTPRVAHALVELNGRKLGLYVLKEGFTEEFLALHFRRTNGNLYDTGPGHDVNEALTRDSGHGPDDRADLKALADAAQEPEFGKRWQRLGQLLDLDRLLSFMAMEVMAGHRDGYCLAKNNFRLYFDPESGRFVFLPHGMDNLFGRADLPIRPLMAGLVARSVMEIPEGRRFYRERLGLLFTNVFKPEALARRVDEAVARLQPALDSVAARELGKQAALLKQRITARAAWLAKQLSQPEIKPFQFADGIANPTGWRPVDLAAQSKLDQTKASDGRAALRIESSSVAASSWRAKVLLKKGRYRFEGSARTTGVKPLPFGKNHGAALRSSERTLQPSARLSGDSSWTKLAMDFEVTETEAEVELICELRASGGSAWFDTESLRLVRLP